LKDFDAIVIGSGAGGLAAAVSLGRLGQKVLVLEQHYLPGGWCHSFNLGGYRFSPGVHYVGELGPDGVTRKLYEGLGIANDLVFLELNPDGYDQVRVGDERFAIPAGRQRYADRLKERFPKEARGIDGYLDTCMAIYRELAEGTKVRSAKDWLSMPWRLRNTLRYGFQGLDRFLDGFTQDPLLRAILSIQVGDHGVPPKDAPVAMHASVVGHYMEGGWYPMGGARSLPKAFIRQIRKHGGEIRMRAEVKRILFEGSGRSQRAIGVEMADGTQIRANTIISNADPAVTYGKLVDKDRLPPRLARRLARDTWSRTALSLFFAAEFDPTEHGLDSGNLWYAETPDIDGLYRLSPDDVARRDVLPGSFLTVTTMKDRTKAYGKVHTMESFAILGWEPFQRFAGTKYGERGEDYERMKRTMTDKMLATVDHLVPGLRDKVVFAELGTPVTNVHYCASTKGNLYGIDKTRWQMGPFAYPVKSPFEGLYLCGASTLSHGVLGATVSGVAAACAATGASRRDVLTGKGDLLTLPADHPETWPEKWRAKALAAAAAPPEEDEVAA